MDNFNSTLFTDKNLALQVSTDRNTGCWEIPSPPSKYKTDVLYFVGKYDGAVKKFGHIVVPVDLDEKRHLYQVVGKFDNNSLRALLKEVAEIGNSDVPKNKRMTPVLKLLFGRSSGVWYDRYSDVRTTIENEILYRVRTDKF